MTNLSDVAVRFQSLGLPPADRAALLASIRASAMEADFETHHALAGALDTVPGMNIDLRARIISALRDAGIGTVDGGTMRRMNASADAQNRLRQEATAVAKRLNVEIEDGQIVQSELDSALAGRSVDERLRIKSLMASAGMLR
jgi:hypothetical protein